MYSPSAQLNTPADYGFPYKPYEIQQHFMESLYSVLEQKGIGIFESPTGTGKSLSLMCGSLRWLLDHEALVRDELQQKIIKISDDLKHLEEEAASAKDWVTIQHESHQKRSEISEFRHMNDVIQEYDKRVQMMHERVRKGRPAQKDQVTYTKRNEKNKVFMDNEARDPENLNEETQGSSEESKESEAANYKYVKIYFCSRTHSQLSQVVGELKRSSYGDKIRCVSLASRQKLCIHPHVRKLQNVTLINERCLDMAENSRSCKAKACSSKSSIPIGGTCVYKAPNLVRDMTEKTLTEVLDIEDLISASEKNKACPYYATRAATRWAQLIMLPYQMLLHRGTRLQSGIDIHNAVIIIDEAHNLLDTISQMHSVEVTLQQLTTFNCQLAAYKEKYAALFIAANLLKINQLNFVIRQLVKMLSKTTASASHFLLCNELRSQGEFFNINLSNILQFCERTRLAQKLQSFLKKLSTEANSNQNREGADESTAIAMLQKLQHEHKTKQSKRKRGQDSSLTPQGSSTSANGVSPKNTAVITNTCVRPILSFLEALTDCTENGGVLLAVSPDGDPCKCAMKYVLLNPGAYFQEIVNDARAIVIAGGTMQPTSEITEQLFKYCPERVVERFYDHVVPSEAVLPFIVTKGPTGKTFCFSYAKRNNEQLLSELGMLLQNICNVVPAGIVCFLPSYEFMDVMWLHMQKAGYLEFISRKKSLFREPRANGEQSTEQMLAEYAATIKGTDGQGALLFSVVGGKLSEGLNFADDLGRCVIVVGLPYPNRQSMELQERMRYMDNNLGVGSGNEYYENLCIKAVNQCIGRSVRHIEDYACVLLVDERYTSDKIRGKLPAWIGRSLKVPTTFGAIQSSTARYFKMRAK